MALQILGSHLGLYSPPSNNASLNLHWSTDATFKYGNRIILSDAPGVFDTAINRFGLATGRLLHDS